MVFGNPIYCYYNLVLFLKLTFKNYVKIFKRYSTDMAVCFKQLKLYNIILSELFLLNHLHNDIDNCISMV
jgi:hypothetical protein